jgi:hypothetical protein
LTSLKAHAVSVAIGSYILSDCGSAGGFDSGDPSDSILGNASRRLTLGG